MNYPSDEQIAEMMRQLTQAQIDNFLGQHIGTWRWWVLFILLIAHWFIWYKLVDKKRIVELVLFGVIIMVFTITLDEIGFVLSLWRYPVGVIPILPRLTSIDYTMLPIIFMLVYQYFPAWKNFFWALVVLSTVFSFVAEPIVVHLGFYVLIKWLYWYSFPIYIVMGLLARWIVRILIDIERKSCKM
ncbi:hypothetical protein HSX37_05080|uniref:Uncharacterized protein n=1 Tax=Dendrosporobacter quercicolus TaxID=146817 RepID=A0A1G9NQD5_9FIRM|nr:CBO0543 family protein [Dendrosporobacter quercicolus]NSL47416.1 hypothetical protein [Dendrosporobacter quercicolus DSM 1736]SDL88571.1 hypothetical protein SAMN04488502_1011090 [Dendrosporobacter quercicolus]